MISVVINTFNAAKYLRAVLDSVKTFDEIVVCDMESTDNTCDIAREYGCKIVVFPKGDATICEVARDFAIHSASNDWVFVVDADEVIPVELREYLYDFEGRQTNVCGLLVPRQNYLFGHPLLSSYPDYQLRFFRQTKTKWPAVIHCRPIVDGIVRYIPKKDHRLAMIHLSDSVSATINRMNKYTDNEVSRRKGTKVTLLSIMFKPLFRFLTVYIKEGGFRYGIVGYIQAQQQCFYKFTTLCKLYEDQSGVKY